MPTVHADFLSNLLHSIRESRMGRRQLLQLAAALGVLPASTRLEAAQPQLGDAQGPQPPDLIELARPDDLRREDWAEPWVWRPGDWANESLDLQVVGNAHPARRTIVGNRSAPLFSFNGSMPGPTIRMRGDERLRISLRNLLNRNSGAVPIGPSPFAFQIPDDWADEMACRIAEGLGQTCDTENLPFLNPVTFFGQILQAMNVELIETALLNVPVNLSHASHTTNLHTHGLHVEPETNPNGTAGDNVLLRVIPRGDYEARQEAADPAFRSLGPNERVGQVEFEHRLGDVGRTERIRENRAAEPHPPGTHWYHPHSHGSTNEQVGSGMAGFLIVEGDVDDAINMEMTGTERPDPTLKTGPFDYRERLVMFQRVEISPLDYDRGPGQNQLGAATGPADNVFFNPSTMFMRPGAVERWRVLNASVDGFGVKNFMVLEGHYDTNNANVWRVLPGGNEDEPRFERMSRQDIEDAKVGIYQLSFDGITLVSVEDGQARYAIRDLSNQNAGTRNPMDREPEEGESTAEAALRSMEDCYRDGDSLRNLFVRPNQIYMANANRADVFFKAPLDAAGKVYTIFSQGFLMHFDNPQRGAQLVVRSVARGQNAQLRGVNLGDDVIGYVYVTGDPVPGGDFDVMSLNRVLPEVPSSLQPISDDELRVPDDEAARRGVPAGEARTRVVSYSGFGAGDLPLVEVPGAFAAEHPELQRSVWDEIDGVRVLVPRVTMAINADFDLAANSEPDLPYKFGHTETDPRARPLVDTAEEWVVYNCTMPLWGHTDLERYPQPGQFDTNGVVVPDNPHYRGYPLTRAEGQARFAEDPEFMLVTRGVDHPFHIHINPCWVLRIEVPDEQGRLHNILPEPCWMDTVSIPRDGGRIVFRSRFHDYVGKWVHHCHTLLHEDFGMMQLVECVGRPEDANYRTRQQPATADMASEQVSAIYPRPSRELMYRQNLSFVDTHPLLSYSFPGFDLEVPELDDD